MRRQNPFSFSAQLLCTVQQLRNRIFIGLFSDHGFYYNPNIYPDEEYLHRVKEQQHLICQIPQKYPVSFLEGDFDKERFYDMAKGLEKDSGRRRTLFSVLSAPSGKKRHSLQRNMDLTISARHSQSVL